jgi:DNA repair protein RecO (recombination protein O)
MRMPVFSTPAILLRRLDYGDFDVIITFFTLEKGKVSVIAKSAKKSTKRFGGVLELFSELQVLAGSSRGKGLPVLQEAVLKQPFSSIRADYKKTAYASYWSELIYNWIEENFKQVALYYLLEHVLYELDAGKTEPSILNILFQMRFLGLSGHRPNFNHCGLCQKDLANIKDDRIAVNLQRGGIVCGQCSSGVSSRISLGIGTIRQLLWVESGKLAKAARIRFSASGLADSTNFLEEFVCYHLGKEPRSLKFLRQIRKGS